MKWNKLTVLIVLILFMSCNNWQEDNIEISAPDNVGHYGKEYSLGSHKVEEIKPGEYFLEEQSHANLLLPFEKMTIKYVI